MDFVDPGGGGGGMTGIGEGGGTDGVENGNGNAEGGSEYSADYDESAYMPENEFNLLNSVMGDGIQKDKEIGVSTLAFDSHEELLWAGTKSGHVTSYYGTQLQKYTSFQVHPTDEVRNILTSDQGILALTNTSLRSQIRRGIPVFTHTSENMTDMHSILFNSRNGRILMGGMQENLIEFDLTTTRETKVESIGVGGSCAILRDHSRFVCCGDAASGKIHLRDPLNLKVTHTLDTNTGVLSDFDVHGHHLVTCGQSLRHGGVPQPDRFLMVYDLRILRAINPIQVMVLPYQLRFLPAMSSRIAVLSSMGQVQVVDTAALTQPQLSVFQVSMPMEGCSTVSMDISPSNQCVAFGDTSNSLHLYSSVAEPVLNPYARDTEFADHVETYPHMDISDPLAIYASIPRPHLPEGQAAYLSDYWPDRFNRQVYRPTPEIEPEILRSMKVVGTIGYARNMTHMKRNQVRYPTVRTKDLRDREVAEGRDKDGVGGTYVHPSIPKMFRKVVIKLGRFGLPTDEFDFDRYNRTGFCGLEATLPNSYCNAMLQILYFTEKLRILMLNHTCNRENCTCCELSFIFHMIDISPPGIPCQSGNFLRAMRTIPEASALGLIFPDQNAVWKSNVPRLIQSWNRFILHQLMVQSTTKEDAPQPPAKGGHKGSTKHHPAPPPPSSAPDSEGEISPPDEPLFSMLFGLKQEKVNVCSKCKVNVSTKDTILLCNLTYPDTNVRERVPFEQIVCSSMCPEQVTPAWCDKCRRYQPTHQSRNLRSLPHILSLNAGMDNAQDVAFWQTQMEVLYEENKPPEEVVAEAAVAVAKPAAAPQQQPPPHVKPCRYGQTCNRPDCKFWHPDPDGVATKDEVDIGDQLAKLSLSYVPMEITINRHENGKVSYGEKLGELENVPIEETKIYQLYGVCSTVNDAPNGQPHNIIAAINVGPFYHSRIASAVSQWYILNDFSINTIMPMEAVWFNLSWKIPCVFFYQAATEPARIGELSFANPITSEVFLEDKSLALKGRKRISFNPLSQDEMPKKGGLVAIDAEFVTLNQEESELRSDGKVSTIKAAQMSVARITCVRGSGSNEGQPFIDDYISTQEQVVDYVTKFSGIKPGDLDANFSSKHLTTLKSTYKKLRYLVDTGCIFIGHGLKNDFKVINLVVPIDQVIDTVHLYHLPHNRMVSLKFLAYHFLGKKIQGVTHDSIEDAVTALQLYKKYLQIKAQDRLIESLNALYDKGKECNWKVPDDE